MKILKSAVMTTILAPVFFASIMAQPDMIKTLEKKPPNAVQSYYERPDLPDSFTNVRRRKSGRNEKYLNINELPATLVLGLLNSVSPDENHSVEASGRKTFDISLYRVQQSMSVCLNIEKQLGERVIVLLLNAQREELHAESVDRLTRKYARRFDLARMKDGTYTLEVRNGPEVIRRTLKLSSAEPVEQPSRTIAALN